MSNGYTIETEIDVTIPSEDSSQKRGRQNRSKTHVHMGRVTGVINDTSAQSGAINFVFVSGKGKNNDANARVNKNSGGSLALPLFPGFRNLPLKNEFVFIIPSVANADMPITSYFYISAVNTFNSGVYNPDALELDLIEYDNIDLGTGIIETNLDKLRKLLLFPGDTSLEGRFGNTIRLGNSNTGTPYKGEQNSPITIIRNGQKDTQGSLTPVSEDINKDNSSIYLTKGQTIDINVISPNLETFGVKEKNTTTEDDIEKLELSKDDFKKGADSDAAVVKNTTSNNEHEYNAELMKERYPSVKGEPKKTPKIKPSDEAFVLYGSDGQMGLESPTTPPPPTSPPAIPEDADVYYLENGTYITFETQEQKKTAVATKDNTEVYRGVPSFTDDNKILAEVVALNLNSPLYGITEPPR